MTAKQDVRTILVLTADPVNADRLLLDQEARRIRECVKRSNQRDTLRVETRGAVTADDLCRSLLDVGPDVVHFSGHGGGTAGLCFVDEANEAQCVAAEPLARLFHLFADQVKCVVLNACYSEVQAKAIQGHIDYTVGMKLAIGDAAAIKFSEGFYDAIGGGRSYEDAYKFGCNAIEMFNLGEELTPVLLKGKALGGAALLYSPEVAEIESFLKGYLNTPFGERWPLTVEGEALRERIARHYTGQVQRIIENVSVLRWRPFPTHLAVAALVSSGGQQASVVYYLVKTPDGFKMAWEATAGYNEVSLTAFRALGPAGWQQFRVLAKLGHDFFYDMADMRDYFYHVRLYDPANAESLDGYIRKDDPTAVPLIRLLADGQEHRITVRVCHFGSHDSQVLMAPVSLSWVVDSGNQSIEPNRGP
jgi:hypothetical protein